MNFKTRCAANTRSAIHPPTPTRTAPSAKSKSKRTIRTGRYRPAKATTRPSNSPESRVAETFEIRAATIGDSEIIAAHRLAMFFEMGYREQAVLDAMIVAFRPWLRRKMDEGEYLAWFAVRADGAVAAGLGLWLMDWPPHMIGPGSRRGNILNVYTNPDSRRQGLARRLMQVALEWCRVNRIRAVILHSSNEGRPLYEKLGFRSTNEMRIMLDGD